MYIWQGCNQCPEQLTLALAGQERDCENSPPAGGRGGMLRAESPRTPVRPRCRQVQGLRTGLSPPCPASQPYQAGDGPALRAAACGWPNPPNAGEETRDYKGQEPGWSRCVRTSERPTEAAPAVSSQEHPQWACIPMGAWRGCRHWASRPGRERVPVPSSVPSLPGPPFHLP